MKNILTSLLFVIVTSQINAQSNYLPITPFVNDDDATMTSSAKSVLKNKLSQIVLQNGLSTGLVNYRFIITSKIIVIDKFITQTVPALISVNIDLPLSIGDGFEGIKFSQTNLSLKGVGNTEEKAMIDALKGINVKDETINAFINNSKKGILEYYNNNCDMIINEAKSLESQSKHDAAIAKLLEVPNSCKECYTKTLPLLTTVYKRYKERECKILMNEAENTWSSKPNIDGANEVANILKQIDPETDCFKKAEALVKQIKQTVNAKINEIDKREWDLKLLKEKNNIDLQKEITKNTKEIAIAFASTQPKVIYHIEGW